MMRIRSYFLSLVILSMGFSLANSLYAPAFADDAAKKALEAVLAKCAGQLQMGLVQEHLRVNLSQAPVGPVYHDSNIHIASRPSTGQIYVTGPTGKDFGMVVADTTKNFGFGAPDFNIHHLTKVDGNLRSIVFDGFGNLAIGVFESAISESEKALVIMPLAVTNEEGALNPIMAQPVALPLPKNSSATINFWNQPKSHQFFMTDGSRTLSVFEITPNWELKQTHTIAFDDATLKIHQISFLSDGMTGYVHFQFGKEGRHAIAAVKIDEQGIFRIAFDSAVLLRDGTSAPLSIDAHPTNDMIYINYDSSYDVLSLSPNQKTFVSSGTHEHSVAGTKAIHFHWTLVRDPKTPSIVVTPTFATSVAGRNQTQIYWGESRMFPVSLETVVNEKKDKEVDSSLKQKPSRAARASSSRRSTKAGSEPTASPAVSFRPHIDNGRQQPSEDDDGMGE